MRYLFTAKKFIFCSLLKRNYFKQLYSTITVLFRFKVTQRKKVQLFLWESHTQDSRVRIQAEPLNFEYIKSELTSSCSVIRQHSE